MLPLVKEIKSDPKYSPYNAAQWYNGKVRQLLGGQRVTQMQMLSANQENLTTQVLPGHFYMFGYYPKHHDTLPYYDRFPLVIPFSKQSRTFHGLNFHYLPYQYRLTLLQKLMTFAQHNKQGEVAMLKFSWNLISNFSKFREVEPAVKCYLHGQVKTRFIHIPPEDWTVMTMLPSSNFAKEKDTNVWKNSKQMMGY